MRNGLVPSTRPRRSVEWRGRHRNHHGRAVLNECRSAPGGPAIARAPLEHRCPGGYSIPPKLFWTSAHRSCSGRAIYLTLERVENETAKCLRL
jgi:hypothetical protein